MGDAEDGAGKAPHFVILCESRESIKILAKNGPPLCSEGDEGEWAMVKMVQGKHPIPSFSAKAGNPERQLAKNGPPLCSEGDECAGKHPSPSVFLGPH
jgi:hypothetical protein